MLGESSALLQVHLVMEGVVYMKKAGNGDKSWC